MAKFIVNSAILTPNMDPLACSMGLPKMLRNKGIRDIKVVTCYCCGEHGKVVAHFEAPNKEYLSKALRAINFPAESIMEVSVLLPKEVSEEKAFYFYTEVGNYTGQSASSLEQFLEKVKIVDTKSLEFHLYRGDFEMWFREVLEDPRLEEEMRVLKTFDLKGETLRTRLLYTISKFLGKQKT